MNIAFLTDDEKQNVEINNCPYKPNNKILEHKTGMTVSSTLKKPSKKLYMFYFETFRIILNPSSVKKMKQRI